MYKNFNARIVFYLVYTVLAWDFPIWDPWQLHRWSTEIWQKVKSCTHIVQYLHCHKKLSKLYCLVATNDTWKVAILS